MAPTALSRSKTPTKIPQLALVPGGKPGPGGSRARRASRGPSLLGIADRSSAETGGLTQARSLDEVPGTVADLVALMTGADPADVEVDVKAHVGAGLSMNTLRVNR